MPQSLAQVYLHLVFSTKNRQARFQNVALREELHNYLGGTCNGLDSPSLIVGGVADHVHILCRLGRTIAIATLVRDLKRESSKWVKTKGLEFDQFHWQEGYGAFSISPGHVDMLREYIRSQEEHHRKESFQDELRRIMWKYGVVFDERYVWD